MNIQNAGFTKTIMCGNCVTVGMNVHYVRKLVTT